MKIQVASDLHLEFHGKNLTTILTPAAPILCLVGDICVCGSPADFRIFIEFLKFYCPKFEAIIHVAGNHEYYTASGATKKELINNTISEIDKRLVGLTKYFPNYHYLNNSTWTYTNIKLKKKIVFIGSTLWTYIPKQLVYDKKSDRKVDMAEMIQRRMNDYNYIYVSAKGPHGPDCRRYIVGDMQRKHKAAVLYLKKTIAKAKAIHSKALQNKTIPPTFVLLTHHKPLYDAHTARDDIYTHAYESDLASQLIIPPIALAAHGHTHDRYDKKINGVRVVSNPKGYIGEQTGFNTKFVVNV